jgi:threonine/homoserine/homoserine lactone efflux protein
MPLPITCGGMPQVPQVTRTVKVVGGGVLAYLAVNMTLRGNTSG